MRVPALFILALSMPGMIGCQSTTPGNLNSMSSLLPGDFVKVLFDSQGCFHHSRYVLTIHREGGFKVKIASAAYQERILGEIPLSKSDVENLDRLVQSYRGTHEQTCTTTETILISRFHKGNMVNEERLVDTSCLTLSRQDSISFSSLIHRIDKNGDLGKVLGNLNSVEIVYQPPTPEYPVELRQSGVQGDLEVVVRLNKDGQITEIIKKYGPDELMKSAEIYLRSFVFKVNRDQYDDDSTVPFHFMIKYRLPKKSKGSK